MLQDVSGGKPVPVEGTALPLWGLEIDPDRAKEDFRAFNARDDGKVGHIACRESVLNTAVGSSRNFLLSCMENGPLARSNS